jgi:hypothetical protein
VRRWVLVCCVQWCAWAWDAPAAVESAEHELAPNPYWSPLVLAPNPYPDASNAGEASVLNRRSRPARVAGQRASSPYGAGSASLAPMPYAGRMPGRELARPSPRPLALAASPYDRLATPELASDPY